MLIRIVANIYTYIPARQQTMYVLVFYRWYDEIVFGGNKLFKVFEGLEEENKILERDLTETLEEEGEEWEAGEGKKRKRSD